MSFSSELFQEQDFRTLKVDRRRLSATDIIALRIFLISTSRTREKMRRWISAKKFKTKSELTGVKKIVVRVFMLQAPTVEWRALKLRALAGLQPLPSATNHAAPKVEVVRVGRAPFSCWRRSLTALA